MHKNLAATHCTEKTLYSTSSGLEFDPKEVLGVRFDHAQGQLIVMIMWYRDDSGRILLDSSIKEINIHANTAEYNEGIKVTVGRMIQVKEDVSFHVCKRVDELDN